MKDPAILFYTGDFLNGCTGLTFEERGQYITLLCLQHQTGHLSEKTIRLSVGSVSVDVLKKFKTDENGLMYNERLDLEIEKRHSFVDSRRENGLKGGRPKKASAKPNDKPKENLLENENIIENINSSVIDFDKFWDSYHEISKKPKTDKDSAKKYWDKLKIHEKKKAFENIKLYCDSISESRYIKKARTYLSDKNFNDEFGRKEIIFSGNLDDYNFPGLLRSTLSESQLIDGIKKGIYKRR